MSRPSQIVALLFFSAAALCSWAEAQSPQKRPHIVKARKTVRAPAPTLDKTVPPPPPTPEQLPAQPPQVSYLNGQLTIISQNSTLSDILTAVRRQTGAQIEIPAAASERVAGRMGPGPARTVIAELLNGSHFDYVMIASP